MTPHRSRAAVLLAASGCAVMLLAASGCAVMLLAASGCATQAAVWDGLDTSSGQRLVIRSTAAVEYQVGGVYRSPQLGSLRLWQYGARVCGRFDYARGDEQVTGVLGGTLRGNHLRFDWRELRRSVDDLQNRRGDGQFFYDPPAADQPRPRLFGDRDYVWRFHLGHKTPVAVRRVGDGPITAVLLAPISAQQTPACAADCSC